MTVEAAVRERLDEIVDPCSAANGTDLSIVDMGLLESVDVDGTHVTVSMRLTTPFCMQLPYFVEEVEGRVADLEWVESVELETDDGLQWHAEMMREEARRERQERKAARAEALAADDSPVGEGLADEAAFADGHAED